MNEEVKKYLHKCTQDNGMNINLRELSDAEIFRLYVFFKEGINLDHMAEIIFNHAKKIIDKTNIKERLEELRKEEVSAMDFETDEQLADWIEYGKFEKK